MNAELRTIYEADQADRRSGMRPDMAARDRDRRRRVLELLAAGQVVDGPDYFHAAMVFQHGGSQESYRRARDLALRAVELGHRPGRWLAAALGRATGIMPPDPFEPVLLGGVEVCIYRTGPARAPVPRAGPARWLWALAGCSSAVCPGRTSCEWPPACRKRVGPAHPRLGRAGLTRDMSWRSVGHTRHRRRSPGRDPPRTQPY